MKKFAVVLSVPVLLSACAYFQKNPDAVEPVTDTTTQRSVNDVVACMTQVATKHNAAFIAVVQDIVRPQCVQHVVGQRIARGQIVVIIARDAQHRQAVGDEFGNR